MFAPQKCCEGVVLCTLDAIKAVTSSERPVYVSFAAERLIFIADFYCGFACVLSARYCWYGGTAVWPSRRLCGQVVRGSTLYCPMASPWVRKPDV